MRLPRSPLLLGAILLSLAAVGCSEERTTRPDDHHGGGGSGGDDGGGVGGTIFGETRIYDLQDPARSPGAGAEVVLRDVVVTAVVDQRQAESGEYLPQHFFVQEREGGKWSGVYVLNGSAEGALVDPPAVGDAVDLAGVLEEYHDRTQIKVLTLENQGPAEVPSPEVVDPLAVATGGPDQEAYEGVLIEVRDVVNVEDPVLGTDGVDRGGFRVGPEGGTEGLILGTMWRDDYRGKVGDRFQSIVGILDFSWEESRLETRGNADITLEDGSHPKPPEMATYTIQQIQDEEAQDGPEPKSPVRVEDAVVTTVGKRGFWIQQGTGPWSGIYVFRPGSSTVQMPNVGDRVNVEGTYDEYWELSQIVVDAVEVEGQGTLPTPERLPVEEVGAAPAAEKWEGVLVEVVDVVNVQDPVKGTDGDDRGDFAVAPIGQTEPRVVIGANTHHDYAGQEGDRFQSIVGPLDFSFEFFRIQPRDNQAITFEDGTHPGPGEADAYTVYEIQDAGHANHPGVNSTVILEDVVVTAVGDKGGSFYVADPAGGPWSGIYVFRAGKTVPALQVGDLVRVEGTYIEHFDESQIRLEAVEVTGSGTPPAPIDVEPETIATGSPDAEQYEGVLVRVTDVVVSMDGESDTANFGAFRVAKEGDTDWRDDLIVDDDFEYGYTARRTIGDRFESITGMLDTSHDNYRLMPRGDADLVEAR